MWKYFNPNPLERNVDDCAVRAIAKALNIDWETAFALLANAGFNMGDMPNANSVISAVLRQHGFYRKTIPDTCPNCYTAANFCTDHPQGVFVLGFGTHVATVENGTLWDAWNSSNEIPVYYYYRKEDE